MGRIANRRHGSVCGALAAGLGGWKDRSPRYVTQPRRTTTEEATAIQN